MIEGLLTHLVAGLIGVFVGVCVVRGEMEAKDDLPPLAPGDPPYYTPDLAARGHTLFSRPRPKGDPPVRPTRAPAPERIVVDYSHLEHLQ